jgi:hypothetical protein
MIKSDIFNEQLITRQQNSKDLLKKIGFIVAGFVILGLTMVLPIISGFFPVILVVVVIGEVFLLRRFNVEYEYVFTNGDFDVDKIINKSKRKRTLSVNVNQFIIMVPVMNKDYAREIESFTKVFDISSGVVNENTYAAIYELSGSRVKLIFEPNQKMFDAIRSYIPRTIKK